MKQERAESLISDCFLSKIIDFGELSIGTYLEPSEAIAGLSRILGDFSNAVHIEAEDSHNKLRIFFTRDIAEHVETRIGSYLEDYVTCEETANLSKEEMKRFWISSQSMLALEHSFQQEKLKITLTGSKLKITGARVGVRACLEKLRTEHVLTVSPSPRGGGSKNSVQCCQTQLSKHMASLMANPGAKTFVKKVFNHLSLKAEVTPDCSSIKITESSNSGGPGGTIKAKKIEKLPTSSKYMSVDDVMKIIREKERDLTDRLLMHVDESSGKLVIVGTGCDVDRCLQVIKMRMSTLH